MATTHDSRSVAARWFAEFIAAGMSRENAAKLVNLSRAVAKKKDKPVEDVRENMLALVFKGKCYYEIEKVYKNHV